eukprot:NODE_8_length_47770_cov_0.334354.p19 type:complete len:134 gc:universal NODE_8_length_47770_cov_0.334354:43445-43044(-)
MTVEQVSKAPLSEVKSKPKNDKTEKCDHEVDSKKELHITNKQSKLAEAEVEAEVEAEAEQDLLEVKNKDKEPIEANEKNEETLKDEKEPVNVMEKTDKSDESDEVAIDSSTLPKKRALSKDEDNQKKQKTDLK